MSGSEPGFARVHPLSPLLRGGLVVVALAVTGGRQLIGGDGLGWPWWVLPLIFVVSLLGAGVSWWFTRYRVGADELRIDSGVLARRSRRIRLDRIQAIEVQQPLLARMFGMASLAIETAGGGSDSEVTLAYLSLPRATALRRHLLVEAGREGGRAVDADERPSAVGGGRADGDGDGDILHRVAPGLLLSAQLLRTGPVLAVLAAVAGVVATGLAAGLGTGSGVPVGLDISGSTPGPGMLFGAAPFAVLVPVVLAFATTVGKGFVGGYDFTLRRSARGLSVRAGLLGVRNAALPVERVRGLVLIEPFVWRRLGWIGIDVTVAGVAVGSQQDRRLATTVVPVATRADARKLVAQVLPGLDLDAVRLSPPPPSARRLDPLARRVLGLGVDERHVVTRRGLLTRRTDVAPTAAVQSRGLRQGPLQRRLGLATVDLHLPSGPVAVTAPHRLAADAWRLMLDTAPVRPPR